MKYVLILISFLFIANKSIGQNIEPSNPGWLTNLNDAYAESKKTGKPILANFTGSDWCGWCKKLTATVFSQPDFAAWASISVVLLEFDYPRGKDLPQYIRAQNENMKNAMGVSGYPSVFLFDLKMNEAAKTYDIINYGRTGYKATVLEFTGEVEKMMAAKAIR